MMKTKKILVILSMLVLMIFVPKCNTAFAKASDIDEENFANVVLFAHFAGDKAQEEAEYFEKNRNKIIGLYDGSQGRSVTNYLNTISYGKFHLKNIFPQDDGEKITSYELKIDKNLAYQMNIDSQIIQEMIKNIPGVKDKIIDYDGDGYIDNLTIMLYGGEKGASSNTTFVSHKSDYSTEEYWSGKKIGAYNILNTATVLGTGTELRNFIK